MKLNQDNIKYIRSQEGLKTQKELAAELGVAQETISQVLRGKTHKERTTTCSFPRCGCPDCPNHPNPAKDIISRGSVPVRPKPVIKPPAPAGKLQHTVACSHCQFKLDGGFCRNNRCHMYVEE